MSCPEKDENQSERNFERNLKISEDKKNKEGKINEYNNLFIDVKNYEYMNLKKDETSPSITIKLLNGDGRSDFTAEFSIRSSYDCMDVITKPKRSSEMEINSTCGLKAIRKLERNLKLSQTQKITVKKPKKEFNEDFILEEDDEYDQAYFKNSQAQPCLMLQRTNTAKLDIRNRSLSSIFTKLHGRGKIVEVDSD